MAATDVKEKAHHPALYNPRARRLHVALLLMFGFFCTSLMRMNLGIALVCMVNSTALAIKDQGNDAFVNRSDIPKGCVLTQGVVNEYEGSLAWTPAQQGLLFSASFWGALVTGLPAGWLADRYGPKMIFFGAALLHIFSTLFTPLFATQINYWAVFGARLIIGLGQGFILPVISSMVAQWFPPLERSSVVAIYTSGHSLSGVIGNPIAALLCTTAFLDGWPNIFYFCGALGIVWAVLWMLFVADSPRECTSMSPAEQDFLETALSGQTITGADKKNDYRVPWKGMLLSLPLYANLFVLLAANFTVTLIMAYLPTYFKEVLFLEIKNNGLYTAMPYVMQVVFRFVWGPAADAIKKSGWASATTVSKICQMIANFGCGIAFVCLAYLVDCSSPSLALFLLCVQGACLAGMVPGVMTSMLSLAPAYSGTLSSLCMTIGMTGSIVAPIFVGHVNNHGSLAEWRTVFLTAAAVLISTGTFFMIFASADMQSWAKPPVSRTLEGREDRTDSHVADPLLAG